MQRNEPDRFTDYEDLRLPVKAAQNSEGPSMSASYTEAASVAATLLDTRQVARLLHVSEVSKAGFRAAGLSRRQLYGAK